MKTKNLFTSILIALLFLFSVQLSGQKLEIAPFVGYMTGANIHYNAGNLHIGDGMNFGGSLNVGMGGGRYVELSYNHLASYLDNETGINTVRLCDLNTDYYSIGVLQEIKPDAKATPYGMFTLGWVNYRPQDTYNNENKMHVSIAGGVKVNMSEKVGIRLQARMLMPLYYAGTYFSAGTGGVGYGVSGGIVGLQGDFTAALVLKLR